MDDLINRQEVIKYFAELWECIGTIGDREEWEDVCVTTVNEIPSAEPRRKGTWIEQDDCWDGIYYECSVCKYSFSSMEGTPSDNDYYFCPSCGSYNGGEDDEID